MNNVCHEVDSWMTQGSGVQAWHRRKEFPYFYIPEHGPMQDAFEKTEKTTYFKLSLLNTGNKLKVDIWASGNPEQFLLHVRTVVYIFKQLGLDTDFANASVAVEVIYSKLYAAKAEFAELAKVTKKKAKEEKEKDANPDPDDNQTSSTLADAKKACKAVVKKHKGAPCTDLLRMSLHPLHKPHRTRSLECQHQIEFVVLGRLW